jgi:DNA-binding Lrp family transcriptional regulator
MSESADRKIARSFYCRQADLASKLGVTRQALGIHFKKLREMGLIQVGRGFVNITDDGLRALGLNVNPVIVTVKIPPQKRFETIQRIKEISVNEVLRVTGESDLVLIVEQHRFDEILTKLSAIDEGLEVKSLVTIEMIR